MPPPIVEAAARGWEKNIQGSETKRKVEKMGEEERGGGRETLGNEDRSFRVWEFDKGLCNKRGREQQKYQKGNKKEKGTCSF